MPNRSRKLALAREERVEKRLQLREKADHWLGTRPFTDGGSRGLQAPERRLAI